MSNTPVLYVPDLRTRSEVRDGNAACIACGNWLPVTAMDVVGLGYRCTACAGRGDEDHLTAVERRRIPRDGLTWLLLGAGLVGAGMVSILLGSSVAPPVLNVIGLAVMLVGYLRMTKFFGKPISVRGLGPLRLGVHVDLNPEEPRLPEATASRRSDQA